MTNPERFIREPHKGPHKRVSNPGEVMLNTEDFAPEGTDLHDFDHLPIESMGTILSVSHYAKENRLARVRQALEDALRSVDPRNPEEYVKPESPKPPISLVRNEGHGLIVTFENKRKRSA